MKNHRSLKHSMMQGGRAPGGAHRAPSAGVARTRAIRGIAALVLTLSGLGAVALAWPGHVSAGHVQVSSQRRVHSPARHGGLQLMVNKTTPKPWMY